MRRLLVLCLLMIAFVPAAHSEALTSKFLELYDRGSAEAKRAMETDISTVEMGLSWANIYQSVKLKQRSIYCTPDKVVLQGGQLIDILRRSAKARQADVPFGLELLIALEAAFPCRTP